MGCFGFVGFIGFVVWIGFRRLICFFGFTIDCTVFVSCLILLLKYHSVDELLVILLLELSVLSLFVSAVIFTLDFFDCVSITIPIFVLLLCSIETVILGHILLCL